MKKSRFTESQIMAILKQHEAENARLKKMYAEERIIANDPQGSARGNTQKEGHAEL